MRKLFLTCTVFLAAFSFAQAQTTFTVYTVDSLYPSIQLEGPRTASLLTKNPTTQTASQTCTLSWFFECSFTSMNGSTQPTATGSAVIASNEYAYAAASDGDTVGTQSSAYASAAMDVTTASATATPHEQNVDPEGPNENDQDANGSSFVWYYIASSNTWNGTIALESGAPFNLYVNFTESGQAGGGSRDYAEAEDSLTEIGSDFIKSNNITVSQS